MQHQVRKGPLHQFGGQHIGQVVPLVLACESNISMEFLTIRWLLLAITMLHSFDCMVHLMFAHIGLMNTLSTAIRTCIFLYPLQMCSWPHLGHTSRDYRPPKKCQDYHSSHDVAPYFLALALALAFPFRFLAGASTSASPGSCCPFLLFASRIKGLRWKKNIIILLCFSGINQQTNSWGMGCAAASWRTQRDPLNWAQSLSKNILCLRFTVA